MSGGSLCETCANVDVDAEVDLFGCVQTVEFCFLDEPGFPCTTRCSAYQSNMVGEDVDAW